MRYMSLELYAAIASATPDRLEDVLRCVCTHNQEAAALASRLLLTGPKKRKRYEICENCDEEFDTKRNSDDACQFHPGDKKIDWDGHFWADHDEDVGGIIDDLVDVYPEGFIWSCCNKNGKEEGCTIKEHVTSQTKHGKRASDGSVVAG